MSYMLFLAHFTSPKPTPFYFWVQNYSKASFASFFEYNWSCFMPDTIFVTSFVSSASFGRIYLCPQRYICACIHILHGRAEGLHVRPLYSLSAPCCPSSTWPISQEAVSHFWWFPILQSAEVQGCPWFLSCWAGRRTLPFPSASLQALWSAQTQGWLQGSVIFWGLLERSNTLVLSFFPLPLAKTQCLFCMFAFRLWLAEPRSTSLWSWASPAVSFPPPLPLLHPTHREHSVSSLLLLVQNEPPASATARGTFKEQTFEISLPNTHAGRSQTSVPWRSHSPCPSHSLQQPGALSTGLVKHLWTKEDFKEKRPGWRNCHHVLPWLTSPGLTQQLYVCSCEMQHTHSIHHWLILTEWPVSVCQRNSFSGNKASGPGAASCPEHRWAPGGWDQVPAKSCCPEQVPITCPACCQAPIAAVGAAALELKLLVFGGFVQCCDPWQKLLHFAVTGMTLVQMVLSTTLLTAEIWEATVHIGAFIFTDLRKTNQVSLLRKSKLSFLSLSPAEVSGNCGLNLIF